MASGIECWEDFVLSEGTVSYLANRALDVVAPTVGAASWASDTQELAAQKGTDLVWPQSCGVVDVIKDNLFTDAPYMRGAFFYKAIAEIQASAPRARPSARRVLRRAQRWRGDDADMLATIQQVTGYDPTACAQKWLLDLSSATPPTPGPVLNRRRGAASRCAPITNSARATLSPSFSNTTTAC